MVTTERNKSEGITRQSGGRADGRDLLIDFTWSLSLRNKDPSMTPEVSEFESLDG